ncbi:MAG: peptidoglycan-binding protein [Archangium sp.]
MTQVNATSSSAARRTSSTSSGRLQRGASGAEVKELQQLLKAVGLYGANADGKFGPMTEAAVKAFQRQNGLTVDGWAGPQTMAKLRAAATPSVASSGGKLSLGAKGEEVKALQQRLKSLGLYNGAIGGNFGPGTEAAVKAFQTMKGLTVDGWAGPQTMAKLREATTSSVTPPAPSGSLQSALDWAKTQVGAPYVGGASPFRYGTPGNGQTYQQQGQKPYVSQRGVIGYDCSGFVVTTLKKAGINLKWHNSSGMKANLPNVPKDRLQPGDLLVKNGHVAIYLGGGKMIESVPSGVRVTSASTYINDPNYVGRRPQ